MHKGVFTTPLEKKRAGEHFVCFLLPGKKFLHVDHGLSCEDALAVVDRDRVCDDRLGYSVETGEGGGGGDEGESTLLLFSL